jgi:predicted esterase
MRSDSLLARLLVLAVVLSAGTAMASDDLARGAVVDTVACTSAPAHSYALYLPSSYTPDRAWPILYCFDPAARGRVPVERFQRAAETYGYIVVGSNTSRNGIDVREAVNAMWQDTHARFKLDERRVYAAGFSGGARVATGLALGTQGQIAGVIGCGAGFPPNREPSSNPGFVYFGSVGLDDFNLPEMRRLAESLDAVKAVYRIETWPGGHDWPPADECTLAVEWLELQAMRAKSRPVDEARIDAWRERDEARARAREAQGDAIGAEWSYRALAADFDGLRDVASHRARAAELRESKAFRDATKAERDDASKQRQLLAEFSTNLRQLGDAEFRATALQGMRRMVASLRKQADDASNARAQRVARRTLVEALISAQVAADALAEQRQFAAAAHALAVCDEIRPNQPSLLYAIARMHAQSGDRKRAVEALRRAVANGLADPSRLAADPAFEEMRATPEFQEILTATRKTGGD